MTKDELRAAINTHPSLNSARQAYYDHPEGAVQAMAGVLGVTPEEVAAALADAPPKTPIDPVSNSKLTRIAETMAGLPWSTKG